MNCANHADASAVAYCRTCGKALCANCTRPVRGVIYCEDCLGAKMEGNVPASGFVPGAVPPSPGVIPPSVPVPGSGPNPAVAGILAGFFPFGVGSVYTGQYAKGLAHLIVFGLLIAGCSVSDHSGSELLGVVCGIGIAFFYVYQIIDAVRSARAIQLGQPVPDPYGLARSFGGGDKIDTSKIPTGAVVLIGLGILFLLQTIGLAEFGFDRFWPILLILLGAWLFIRNMGLLSGGSMTSSDLACRTRRLMGPAMLTTIGILFLLSNLRVAHFGRTWPIILLVIGAVKLLQGTTNPSFPIDPSVPSNPAGPAGSGTTPPAAPTSGEVNRG